MITQEQIKFFAGEDNLEKSCLEILEELANGEYKSKQFQKDVLYHWERSNKQWDKLPIMCWSLTLYKEDEKRNQKFYEYNGDHSFVSEGIDNKDLREINKEEK